MSTRPRSLEYRFECARCNGCCGGQPGYVWLSEYDLDNLCRYTQLNRREFALAYCTPVDIGIKVTLSLKEKQDYSCIFLGGSGCKVYEVRPSQCRTYPFWEAILEAEGGWENEGHECPGIGQGPMVPPEKILGLLEQRRMNPPLDIRFIKGLENLSDNWGTE